ncbi:hypothetical protein SAMN05216456_2543 [Devosia crocina]|uniref:Uncharacterized protein n=1 Tax=Devosia crocina TaxID=429728 RepID=A0A1I7NPG9_9HYPH|nr:hypothetical protein [Devosia crocina]SFV36556.1 hypothetical protein SAMN05216456_2543 [Devosia crocina]
MVFSTLRDQMVGRDNLTAMQIAQHSLFTAREKLDLLNQLKAEVTSADAEGEDLGVTAGEIDEAITHVREGVQDGVGTQTVLKGDF